MLLLLLLLLLAPAVVVVDVDVPTPTLPRAGSKAMKQYYFYCRDFLALSLSLKTFHFLLFKVYSLITRYMGYNSPPSFVLLLQNVKVSGLVY